MGGEGAEEVILEADKLFRWEARKRKATIFGARLGRLVLTDQRLLFLSTGSSNVGKAMALGVLNPTGGLMYHGKTGHLDLSALDNEGSLAVPIAAVRSAAVTGGGCLTVTWSDETGTEQVSTFGDKNRGVPNAVQWIAALEASRSAPPQPIPSFRPLETGGQSPWSDGPTPTPTPVATTPPPPPPPPTPPPPSPSPPSPSPPPPPQVPAAPAPPSRPAAAVPGGYLNPNRLATTVEEITWRFGLDVLDDPSRVRNLLRDAYGADASRERSDIDTFVAVLDQHPLGELRRGRSRDDVAAAIANSTTLDPATAGWTISVIVRATGERHNDNRTIVDPSDATPGTGASSSRGGRRTVVLALSGALVAVAVAGIAWFAGRSGADDWKQRAEAAEEELAATQAEIENSYPTVETDTYKPELTNIAIGTGGSAANDAEYVFVGGPNVGDVGTLTIHGQLVLGSSGASVTEAFSVSLPPGFEFNSNVGTSRPLGACRMNDSDEGANSRMGTIRIASATSFSPNHGGWTAAPANVSATSPFTWDADDSFYYTIYAAAVVRV